jgi:hexosaminidase
MGRASRQETRFELASPLVRTDRLLFERRHEVGFELGLPGVSIHTTLDGADPTPADPRYDGPLVLTGAATVRARAFHPDWAPSETVTRQFYRIRTPVRSIELLTSPGEAYSGRGAETLLDLRGGSTSFGDGTWLGYQEDDLLAVLDLGEPITFDSVVVSTLAINPSWIFLPAAVSVETSVDGVRYDPAVASELQAPGEPETEGQRFVRVDIPRADSPRPVRYVRVLVRGRGPMPEWHAAPGSRAWLFVDAIAVL